MCIVAAAVDRNDGLLAGRTDHVTRVISPARGAAACPCPRPAWLCRNRATTRRRPPTRSGRAESTARTSRNICRTEPHENPRDETRLQISSFATEGARLFLPRISMPRPAVQLVASIGVMPSNSHRGLRAGVHGGRERQRRLPDCAGARADSQRPWLPMSLSLDLSLAGS